MLQQLTALARAHGEARSTHATAVANRDSAAAHGCSFSLRMSTTLAATSARVAVERTRGELDTAAADAVALLLGEDHGWNDPERLLEDIARVITATGRPDPSRGYGEEAPSYADILASATGRTIDLEPDYATCGTCYGRGDVRAATGTRGEVDTCGTCEGRGRVSLVES